MCVVSNKGLNRENLMKSREYNQRIILLRVVFLKNKYNYLKPRKTTKIEPKLMSSRNQYFVFQRKLHVPLKNIDSEDNGFDLLLSY